MQPIKEDENMTSSLTNIKAKNFYREILTDLDDLRLMEFKATITVDYKKKRNKMTHLKPKKKKRK